MPRTEVLRGCRIVWLNPMLSWQGDEPATRGIVAAALPHVDPFARAQPREPRCARALSRRSMSDLLAKRSSKPWCS
jgi:uncharacterized protein with von Willebrand factor type A (vWA) domain